EQLPAVAPQLSAVPSRTSATFPPEAARFVVPVASRAGRVAPTAAVEASCTRQYRPGWIDPASGVVWQLVAAAEAYGIVPPLASTAELPLFRRPPEESAYAGP